MIPLRRWSIAHAVETGCRTVPWRGRGGGVIQFWFRNRAFWIRPNVNWMQAQITLRRFRATGVPLAPDAVAPSRAPWGCRWKIAPSFPMRSTTPARWSPRCWGLREHIVTAATRSHRRKRSLTLIGRRQIIYGRIATGVTSGTVSHDGPGSRSFTKVLH